MNKGRKLILKQINKTLKIEKTAEEIISEVNQSVEDSQQFAHSIFQELVKNLKIENLD